MAWRIHDSVVRGEIDNRVKGVVRGRLWLHGMPSPVRLELKGNAHADLAGCLLRFHNPGPTIALPIDALLSPIQQGAIGDLTAARKVRVFDIPLDDALAMIHRGEKPPEHLANSLYLEWFSQANGRVVVEAADWPLAISPPEWRLTAQDERHRAEAAAAGLADFMGKLNEAIEAEHRSELQPEPEHPRPLDEFQWERLLRESDARTEKYGELLDKYRDHPDADDIIAKEMGWDRAESDEMEEADNDDPGRPAAGQMDSSQDECELGEAQFPASNQATDGQCRSRSDERRLCRQLQERSSQAIFRLWREFDARGLAEGRDPDADALLGECRITAAKIAGAFSGLNCGDRTVEPGFVVASLKRALGHLHAAQAELERVASRRSLRQPALDRARADLFEIREGILGSMQRFRARL
jgi:hypothetical protein